MSMVERLAKKFASAKYDNRFGAVPNNPIIRFEARWWMNAIADELEKYGSCCGECGGDLSVAYDLREQAKEK